MRLCLRPRRPADTRSLRSWDLGLYVALFFPGGDGGSRDVDTGLPAAVRDDAVVRGRAGVAKHRDTRGRAADAASDRDGDALVLPEVVDGERAHACASATAEGHDGRARPRDRLGCVLL